MKNETIFKRSPKNKKNTFDMFSTELNKLPIIELGLMHRMLANSDDWIINKKEVQKNSKLGRVLFETAWQNLINLGHIIQEPIQSGWRYIIIESTLNENDKCEIPHLTDSTGVESVSLTNTNGPTITADPESASRNEVEEDSGHISLVDQMLAELEAEEAQEVENPVRHTSPLRFEVGVSEGFQPEKDLEEPEPSPFDVNDKVLEITLNEIFKEECPEWKGILKNFGRHKFLQKMKKELNQDEFYIDMVVAYDKKIRGE